MSLLKQSLIKITSMFKQMFNVLVLVMLNYSVGKFEESGTQGYSSSLSSASLCNKLCWYRTCVSDYCSRRMPSFTTAYGRWQMPQL